MFCWLALLILLSLSTMTYSQLDSQFTFSGQNSEVLKAEKKITVITPEGVQVPSTCTCQVPTGQIEVCHNETRHREVCSGSGSHDVCTETATRQVCRTKPDGPQNCTTVGGGQRVEKK